MSNRLINEEPRIPLKVIEDTLDAGSETFEATAMVHACLPQANKTMCGMFVQNPATGESVSVFFQLFSSEIKVHVLKDDECISEVLVANEKEVGKFITLAPKETNRDKEGDKGSAPALKNPLISTGND